MVTEDHLYFAHFLGPISPPRGNLFEIIFRLTCSASSNLDLFLFEHTVSVDLGIRAQEWLYPSNLTEPSHSFSIIFCYSVANESFLD